MCVYPAVLSSFGEVILSHWIFLVSLPIKSPENKGLFLDPQFLLPLVWHKNRYIILPVPYFADSYSIVTLEIKNQLLLCASTWNKASIS
jgi:hypothetical protein